MPPRVISGIEEMKKLIGQQVGTSDPIEVSQSRINQFADTTGDHQWIHIDVERAATETPFKSTIAHGFLTLSLISQMASQAVKVKGNFKMGINYGLNRVRFTAPVPGGSMVTGVFNLQAVEPITGGWQITWNVAVSVQGASKPSLIAEWLVRYYE